MTLPPPPLLLQRHLRVLSDHRRVSISLPDLRGSSNPLRFTIIIYYHALISPRAARSFMSGLPSFSPESHPF